MRRLSFLLLAFSASCESSTAPPDVYPYETLLPAGYNNDPAATFPLIFALHGAAGPGSIDATLRARVAGDPQFGFIVVLPDASEAGWVTTSLRQTLDEVRSKYRVNADRVYVTGMSAGAYAGWRLAASRPHDFAAIVLLAGGGVDEFACTLKHVPVWLIHNQADNVVPASESIELHDAIQACNGLSILTVNQQLPTGVHPHDAWTAVYSGSAFYSWLLRHRRGVPGALN